MGFVRVVNRQHALRQSFKKGSPSLKKWAWRGLPPTQNAACLTFVGRDFRQVLVLAIRLACFGCLLDRRPPLVDMASEQLFTLCRLPTARV